MTTTVNIQNLVSNIKSSGWVAMRAAVTGFIRVVMETVLTLEQSRLGGIALTNALNGELIPI